MFIWTTNGIVNKKSFDGKIEQGFHVGFTLKDDTLQKKEQIKNNKKLKKAQLKSLPLKERKIAQEEMKKQEEMIDFVIKSLKPYKPDSLEKRINKLIKEGLEIDPIFNQLKGSNNLLNCALFDLITEKALLFQLSSMPKYINTITDNLQSLYNKNHFLQEKEDLKNYFINYYLYHIDS